MTYKLKENVTEETMKSCGFETTERMVMKRYFKEIGSKTRIAIFNELDIYGNPQENKAYNHAYNDVFNEKMYKNERHKYIIPNVIYLEQANQEGYDLLQETWLIQDLISLGYVVEVE